MPLDTRPRLFRSSPATICTAGALSSPGDDSNLASEFISVQCFGVTTGVIAS